MRVAFLGNAPWSVPSLEALAASSHPVDPVLTRVPRPAGRGRRLRPTAVADAARRLGLPLEEIETVRSGPGFDAIAAAAAEVLVVVAYGEILPPSVLGIPSRMPVNVHFSLLPELRGAAPVQRALLGGLAVTGVTTIRMDEGMDTGPILLHATEAIDPNDDAGSLGARLAAIGGRLLVDTLDRLEAGALAERPQDGAAATFAPKLRREERGLDWTEPAEALARRVRALAPQPGATTRFRDRTLKVLAAAARAGGGGAPGEILPGPGEELAVATGDGALILLEVAPQGRRRMSGGEFVRGHRPQTGEALR